MEQVSRIFRNKNLTRSRWIKAETAGNKYIRNIASMKQFTKDYETGGAGNARKRSYSRNTYMLGLNEG